jgi:DNA-binding MarR family transcriptional regulator
VAPNDRRTVPDEVCALTDDPSTADLTWLTHRAAATLGDVFDAVCREAGLADLRDWLVLALVGEGGQRTQSEIGAQLGIDKTTLVSLLDRLEREGLIVRTFSARDRRVRIPEATAAGLALHDKVAAARDEAIQQRLATIPAAQQALLRSMLWSIAMGSSQ